MGQSRGGISGEALFAWLWGAELGRCWPGIYWSRSVTTLLSARLVTANLPGTRLFGIAMQCPAVSP